MVPIQLLKLAAQKESAKEAIGERLKFALPLGKAKTSEPGSAFVVLLAILVILSFTASAIALTLAS